MKIEEFNRYVLLVLMATWIWVGLQASALKKKEVEIATVKLENAKLDNKIKNKDLKINDIYLNKLNKTKPQRD